MGRCHLDLGEQVDLENMAFTRMARWPGFRDSISRSCVVSSCPTDKVIPFLDILEIILSSGAMWVFPKIRGTSKWMVYNGKPYLKWMIWGENPTIFGNIHVFSLDSMPFTVCFVFPLFHSKALFLPLCLQFEGFWVLSQN